MVIKEDKEHKDYHTAHVSTPKLVIYLMSFEGKLALFKPSTLPCLVIELHSYVKDKSQVQRIFFLLLDSHNQLFSGRRKKHNSIVLMVVCIWVISHRVENDS